MIETRFLMVREVVTLLRELRPEEGLGEGIDQLAALVHHAYLFWAGGSLTVRLRSDQLGSSVARRHGHLPEPDARALYTQLPERRVWAQVIPGRSARATGRLLHTMSRTAECCGCWGSSECIPTAGVQRGRGGGRAAASA